MVTADWHWLPWAETYHTAIEIPFELHSDPTNFSDDHGLYLILMTSEINNTLFYFGVQTGVSGLDNRNTGKGIIYSRWNERDLSNARLPESCFATSSGHEGDFIGLRCPYEWTVGEYSARIAFEEADEGGEWYGLWVTDELSGVETWIGSLRFPKPILSFRRGIHKGLGTALEIYGHRPIKPIDIPLWHVTVSQPISREEGTPDWAAFYYDAFYLNAPVTNNDVWWNADEGHVRFMVGGTTEREHEEQELWLTAK